MNINTLKLGSMQYPEPLKNISSPPNPLYHVGAELNKLLRRPVVAIVGSRNSTYYGGEVTATLARDLAEQGVVIVSGLAVGTDSIAQRAALDAGGICIGVLPTPIDSIGPVTSQALAKRILGSGGALVSEYTSGDLIKKQNFIKRNRIMSGLSKGVLITEAAEKSGTMHTARFAREQNRELMVVPGQTISRNYIGSHNLLKTGAHLVTDFKDVMHILNIDIHETAARAVKGSNTNEQLLLDLMLEGWRDGDDLLLQSGLGLKDFNLAITMLEINRKIRPLSANRWRIF